MMRIFIGYDERQPVSYNVLQASIMRHAKKPVSITPLILSTLPMQRRGLTPFTYSRFICPWLCQFEGQSLFLDSDMMVRADISELFAGMYLRHMDALPAVGVVQHEMKFERSSIMLFNNEHCKMLTPERIDDEHSANPMGMGWAGGRIAALPSEWNHLVGYDNPNPNAKLVHFTQGVPAWPETANCEHADEWRHYQLGLVQAQPWAELMGNSVHAKPVLERMAG